jgi:hypothetical protein
MAKKRKKQCDTCFYGSWDLNSEIAIIHCSKCYAYNEWKEKTKCRKNLPKK